MTTDVTELYRRWPEWHRMSPEQCAKVFSVASFVHSVEESKALNSRKGPMVIVSASGMITGGRVLHHLERFGPDPRNTVLLPGFQAPGTRGGAIAEGARQVKIHGQPVTIEAEVVQMTTLSAHADQGELIGWLESAEARPNEVIVVHGEPAASDALRKRIGDALGWKARVADHLERVRV
jgi:metallo-beta-lactamase family protein